MKYLRPTLDIDTSEPSRYEIISSSFRGVVFHDLKWDEKVRVPYPFWHQVFSLIGLVKITPTRLLNMDESVATYFTDREWLDIEFRMYLHSDFEKAMVADYLCGNKYLHAVLHQWDKEYKDDLVWYMNPWVVAVVPFWKKPAFVWPEGAISVFDLDQYNKSKHLGIAKDGGCRVNMNDTAGFTLIQDQNVI